MKSITLTTPPTVVHWVSRTRESFWYRRSTWPARAAGPSSAVGFSRHWPFRPSPSSAAKTASESNRGRQSQSIEPARLTKAADCMSPISA